jgi:hypothetical protein
MGVVASVSFDGISAQASLAIESDVVRLVWCLKLWLGCDTRFKRFLGPMVDRE